MFRSPLQIVLALLAMVTTVGEVRAQCATYPAPTVVAYQPTVAYQPVVAQPVVVQPRTGWYPGKLWDQLRLRRWTTDTVAPTYTAAYAPYNAAAYSATPYRAAYRPYLTAYAPLARRQFVARPVVLQPTYAYSAASNCCNTCSTGVSQATYNAPAASCSSCATGSFSNGAITGPPTPTPKWPLDELTPTKADYPSGVDTTVKKQIDPTPAKGEEGADDSGAILEAPSWKLPAFGEDRAASRSRTNRPSVNVWNAVYRGRTTAHSVSRSRPTSRTQAERTQAEIDAEGWQAVAR